MERVPQVGMLLVLSPPVAAAICATASLVWPLLSRRYSHGSTRAAVLRAVHNAAMTGLMLLLAGEAYLAAGGRHPLGVPTLEDIGPLAAMTVTAQVVNVALLAVYFRLDGREVRRIIRPVYTLVDLDLRPRRRARRGAVQHRGARHLRDCSRCLMVLFVLSFNGFGSALRTADVASDTLAGLPDSDPGALHGARRIDELGERILFEVRALLRFDEFSLAIVDSERKTLDLRVQERGGEHLPSQRRRSTTARFGWVAARGAAVLVEDWAQAPQSLRVAAAAARHRPRLDDHRAARGRRDESSASLGVRHSTSGRLLRRGPAPDATARRAGGARRVGRAALSRTSRTIAGTWSNA